MFDFRSDTVTRPSEGMREAMASAAVGDDVLGDDPTTNAFQERMAEVLGVEAALFFPSGTQANQVALALHGARGTEVVLEANAHIVDYEEGAASALSGLQLRRVFTDDGRLTPELVAEAIRPAGDPFLPSTSILALENTHLDSGGRAMSPEVVAGLVEVARAAGIAVHLDGARLWNASVATGADPADFGRLCDTVMVSLAKGLGAPVGSVLGGSAEAIARARRLRRRFGGAMRQTGLLTAAADYALDHNWPRLAEDHVRARALYERLQAIDGIEPVEPETNVVFIGIEAGLATAEHVALEARARGVLFSRFGPQRLRAVTHLDVGDDAVDAAVAALDGAVDALG